MRITSSGPGTPSDLGWTSLVLAVISADTEPRFLLKHEVWAVTRVNPRLLLAGGSDLSV